MEGAIDLERLKAGARSLAGGWRRLRGRLTIRWEGLELRFSLSDEASRDWFLPRYASGRRVHEPPVSWVIRHTLPEDGVFFDVGSHLGFFSVLAGHVCRRGEVHAFEADASLLPLIRRSLELNGLEARVRIEAVACSDIDDRRVAYRPHVPGNLSTNRVLTAEEAPSGEVRGEAPTLTLDEHAKRTESTPDLAKVDVEGGEVRVLRGMSRVLREARPDLLLEIHPELLREAGEDPEALARWLTEEIGYDARELVDYRDPVPDEGGPRLGHVDDGTLQGERPLVLWLRAPGSPWEVGG